MNTITTRIALWAALTAGVASFLPGRAQEQQPTPTFAEAAAGVRQELETSVAELEQLRAQMAAEQLPLSRRLADLQSELTDVRAQFQQTTRLLDSRTLDLSNLRGEIKSREEQATYLSNLLGEYARNFEAGLHIAEIQRYEQALEAAKLAPENSNLGPQQVFELQASLLSLSLDRLNEALGGTRFAGHAVDANGRVVQGDYVLIGPIAIFRSADGLQVGSAEQRLGSLEPSLVAFGRPADATAADELVAGPGALVPLDPSLGNARKIEATQESLWEHIKKGGPVMIPIFALAGAALLVSLFKWVSLLFVRTPSNRQLQTFFAAVAGGSTANVQTAVALIKGPVGRMLAAGVEHIDAPRELVEEVMYERVLTSRLKLEGLLPFIAISAAAAPLLGLLGTVTGIINTFKLITVFGSGDVKTLSSGISEALITTEYGLIVAIPSLLLHAFLSRKARGVVGQMETAAVGFLNQLSKADIPSDSVLVPAVRQAHSDDKQDAAVQAAGPRQSSLR